MPMEARARVPSADHPQAAYPAFDDAAEPQLTIYDVAEDSLPTEGLAAALLRKGRRPIWLRLGPQDRDPGTFLVSLATAAARFGAANVTSELMRAKPSPVYGWPLLLAALGGEAAQLIITRSDRIRWAAVQYATAWAASSTGLL